MENNQKNRLTLIKDLGCIKPKPTSNYKKRYGLYKCSCGNELTVAITAVKNNHTRSCGCLRKEVSKDTLTTHGLRNHRIYDFWKNMMYRCYGKNYTHKQHYRDKGIKVCIRWHNVDNFIKDMDITYFDGASLDRVDNNSGYSKDNCRWTNKSIQSQNTNKIRINNTSGYRGVTLEKRTGKFYARITVKNKAKQLGTFDTKIEAAKAYDRYVKDNNLEHTTNF